jgi:hypothetical protein
MLKGMHNNKGDLVTAWDLLIQYLTHCVRMIKAGAEARNQPARHDAVRAFGQASHPYMLIAHA